MPKFVMANSPNFPVLVVVSGPPGSGKSTLAHALATEIGVPAIIRDEIKQGMVLATPARDTDYDDLNIPVLHTFFDVLTVLARAGVSAVAEAAFQDRLWRPGLIPLAELAEIRIIHCTAPQSVLHERIARRAESDPHRQAHNDQGLLAAIAAGGQPVGAFVPVSMDVAELVVDTTDGYQPSLDAITQFAAHPAPSNA
ncbi:MULTISPECIES: AAA family ATPase [Nocardia]|jgi:predicted kinase|uniref:Putative kinase n=2 Tax=Nocardia TaxID=1817 RepID=A0A4R6PL33_NOCIG|nr:ATP-binding protein [Nocardia ignorata]TDP38516.1 putative kinase [Nocardia ignorata]